ncbi:DUF397 domain-containing protein [Embleya sp. NPDC055664]
MAWRTSTYSGNWNADCVAITPTSAGVGVRDSKLARGPILRFGPNQWTEFLAAPSRERRRTGVSSNALH